jgi:hypothetical protein
MDSTSLNEFDEKRTKLAVSLYRHVFWAYTLMKQFEFVLVRDRKEIQNRLLTKQVTFKPKLLESEMYLCLWFGCLYSVIEGWPNLKVDEPHLKELLNKGYKKKLYGFRNATFHPTNYDDVRLQALATEGQKSIDWAREVTNQFKSSLESILVFPN